MFVIQRMRKDKVTFLKEYDGSMGLIVVGWHFSLILLSYYSDICTRLICSLNKVS